MADIHTMAQYMAPTWITCDMKGTLFTVVQNSYNFLYQSPLVLGYERAFGHGLDNDIIPTKWVLVSYLLPEISKD